MIRGGRNCEILEGQYIKVAFEKGRGTTLLIYLLPETVGEGTFPSPWLPFSSTPDDSSEEEEIYGIPRGQQFSKILSFCGIPQLDAW